MISRRAAGVFMPQSFSFLFQQHTHLQVKHKALLVETFSFFCLLPTRTAVWRPSLHLHPTAFRRIWPLIGQILRAVNHCGQITRLFLKKIFSCLGLTWCSSRASQQLCTFAENASSCAKISFLSQHFNVTYKSQTPHEVNFFFLVTPTLCHIPRSAWCQRRKTHSIVNKKYYKEKAKWKKNPTSFNDSLLNNCDVFFLRGKSAFAQKPKHRGNKKRLDVNFPEKCQLN